MLADLPPLPVSEARPAIVAYYEARGDKITRLKACLQLTSYKVACQARVKTPATVEELQDDGTWVVTSQTWVKYKIKVVAKRTAHGIKIQSVGSASTTFPPSTWD